MLIKYYCLAGHVYFIMDKDIKQHGPDYLLRVVAK